MQNTSEPDENTNPEHFPPTSAASGNSTRTSPKHNTNSNANSNATTLATISERTQNFSFATNYRPTGRIGAGSDTANNNIRFNNSSPLSIFHYKPLPSFAVLNNDELQAPPAALDAGKPNAIVRPIRRPEQPGLSRQQRHYVRDMSPPTLHAQQQQQHLATASMTQPNEHTGQDSEHLTEALNRKFRALQYSNDQGAWSKSGNSSRNVGPAFQAGSNQDTLHSRPLFMTTVPTGVFLPPAKEPPLPWFLRPREQVYAYSSHPMVLSPVGSQRKGFSAFAKDTTKLRSSTAAIAAGDKGLVTNATRTSGGDGRRFSPARYSLAGSVHLTKEQFQQQIQQHRTKRETPTEPYKNVMYDRRVVRGSNFGNTTLLADYDPFDKAAELRRRRALRQKMPCRNQRNILGTPPPVKGRCHEVIQTEKYLEELVQRPPELSVDTQTDLFLERPPIPPYVPAKVGVDVGTEIADGELFHFDAEAQPIIDVLVDACIEQSMLEVAHEQELEALRKKQEEYLALREAELAELRRLEAEEMRLQAEKERRLHQDAIAKQLDDEMQKGVTAAKLLQGHIAGLLPEVLDNLEPATDATKKEHLQKTICPWLTVEVAEEVGHIVDSREILTVIIKEIIKQRATAYAGYEEPVPPEQQKELAEPRECEEECAEEQKLEACTCESRTSDLCPPKEEELRMCN